MRYFTQLALLITASTGLTKDKLDYKSDVFPILQKYCVGCHTEDEAQGGLVMESHAALVKGGESGTAVTPGEPSSSRMILMLTHKIEPQMPPEDEAQPSEDEVATLVTWIEQGAIGPDDTSPATPVLRTPKIKSRADLKAPITAITYNATSSRRATAVFGSVLIENNSGQDVATISGLPGKVNSLMFSRDGRRILVGSGLTGSYGRAAVYDASNGKQELEIIGHSDTLYSAVFSPDELQIATAGYDRKIMIWDTSTGQKIRELTGHNGAIFDLVYSPDGKVLASACADETVKIWHVATGKRLDTLGQPEGEVFSVDITPDGKHIVAGSADNRLRIWRLLSKDSARINPIVATRFIDESPIVGFTITPDGKSVVVISESGNVKLIRTSDWNQAAVLQPLADMGTDVTVDDSSRTAFVSLMNGQVETRELPIVQDTVDKSQSDLKPIYLDLGELAKATEADLRKQLPMSKPDSVLPVQRGIEVTGEISQPEESDLYQWRASAGEVWAIDADKVGKSTIDPIVTILDAASNPVLRVRLQAVRDSYFTFRGKDSNQVGDFRIFNWQEMNLKQYLFANGEVVRLWMHPRGPDSGFNVYPGEGKRWTYFGTSHVSHALGEPAYIVEPLSRGQKPLANGLPVFDVYYENDDDPMRIAGQSSRVLFTAPSDGLYTAKISDTRGQGGGGYSYKLAIRPAAPRFKPTIAAAKGDIRRGTGREFTVRVDRFDGFEGAVTFDILDLPPQIKANTPLTIEPGQRYATGMLWVAKDAESWEGKIEPQVVASATVAGRKVERQVGKVGTLTLADPPSVIPSIMPTDRDTAVDEDWTLQVRRGQTASARLVIERKEGFNREVSFGKELAGRNTSAGVYVDNIGLNGLIVLKDSNERTFYLTADLSADLGKRSFFLRASVDGNVTSYPITVEVIE